MRLIDADELLQTVSVKSVFGNEINKMKCGELRKILEMIEDAPTVEPPRIRGRWIDKNGNIVSPFWQRYECSVCGARSDNSNFCPNCGADMRGTE